MSARRLHPRTIRRLARAPEAILVRALKAAVPMLMTLGASAPVLAADLIAPGAYEQDAVHNVSNAVPAPSGAVRGGLRFHSATVPVKAGVLMPEGSPDGRASVRDANRVSLFSSVALTRAVTFSLGLHGTYENAAPALRDALEIGSASDSSWRDGLKQTAFSGASLAVKMHLADLAGLQLAVMPFLESGAGETATWALTRSVAPKIGLIGLASYGVDGIGEVSANIGARYRNPEEIGGLAVRNELFYRLSVSGNVSRNLAIFAAADGRRLMISRKDSEAESGTRRYRPNESGEAVGGLRAELGDMEISAYAGGRMPQAKGFGHGSRSVGLSVALALGGPRRVAKSSFAAVIEKAEKPVPVASEPAKSQSGRAADLQYKDEDYPEMIGAEVDPLAAIEDTSDFRDVERAIEENEKNAGALSDDDKIELELKAIREAEKKAEAERLAQEARDADKRRTEARKRATQDEALMREWTNEANRELDKLEGVTDEQLEWQGLE